MSSRAAQRAALQMERDGIKSLPRWTKRKLVGCAMVRVKLDRPQCTAPTCARKAGYSTPQGNRCFAHAIEISSLTQDAQP